jgi:DnaJ homolog subfamily C member 19
MPTAFTDAFLATLSPQTTPLVAGLAVGAAAYAARAAIQTLQSFKSAGPRLRQFYKGGFLPEMNRREAAQILGESRMYSGLKHYLCGFSLWKWGRWASKARQQSWVPHVAIPPPAGVRESAPEEKVKEAHRRIMIANHPDSGGSSFVAAKINEAKDMMLGKKSSSGSIF